LEVNGVPTKKHFLQNNDMIEIGKYKLKYLNDQTSQTSAADFEKTMVLRAPVKLAAPGTENTGGASPLDTQINPAVASATEEVEKTGRFAATSALNTATSAQLNAPLTTEVGQAPASQIAVVQILTGPNAGKELELVKNLTTLGKPGVQVAVLTRRPHGYFITHVEGTNHPVVNGQVLGDQPNQLNDRDVIELAGVKMEFYFKS